MSSPILAALLAATLAITAHAQAPIGRRPPLSTWPALMTFRTGLIVATCDGLEDFCARPTFEAYRLNCAGPQGPRSWRLRPRRRAVDRHRAKTLPRAKRRTQSPRRRWRRISSAQRRMRRRRRPALQNPRHRRIGIIGFVDGRQDRADPPSPATTPADLSGSELKQLRPLQQRVLLQVRCQRQRHLVLVPQHRQAHCLPLVRPQMLCPVRSRRHI